MGFTDECKNEHRDIPANGRNHELGDHGDMIMPIFEFSPIKYIKCLYSQQKCHITPQTGWLNTTRMPKVIGNLINDINDL